MSVGNRVARLMRANGLAGVTRRRAFKTTRRGEVGEHASDLVDRDFGADGPDQLWVADITYVPTWTGFLYLAVVLDAWSRRIVGWSMQTTLATDVVLDALNMAVEQRRPQSVVHHLTTGANTPRSPSDDVLPGVSVSAPRAASVGDAYDNAMCESFFATHACDPQHPRATVHCEFDVPRRRGAAPPHNGVAGVPISATPEVGVTVDQVAASEELVAHGFAREQVCGHLPLRPWPHRDVEKSGIEGDSRSARSAATSNLMAAVPMCHVGSGRV